MDKNICLELVQISSDLPPLYTHPYHKYEIPKKKHIKKGIQEKIKLLNKTKLLLNRRSFDSGKNYKTAVPRVNLSIVEKQNDKFSRPITVPKGPKGPQVFLNMSYQMFFPGTPKKKVSTRVYSVS
jgi:hypothetical protein